MTCLWTRQREHHQGWNKIERRAVFYLFDLNNWCNQTELLRFNKILNRGRFGRTVTSITRGRFLKPWGYLINIFQSRAVTLFPNNGLCLVQSCYMTWDSQSKCFISQYSTYSNLKYFYEFGCSKRHLTLKFSIYNVYLKVKEGNNLKEAANDPLKLRLDVNISFHQSAVEYIFSPVFLSGGLTQLLSHIVAHQLDVERVLGHLHAPTGNSAWNGAIFMSYRKKAFRILQ